MEELILKYKHLIIELLPAFVSLAIYRRKKNIDINNSIGLMTFILLIAMNYAIVGIVQLWVTISNWILEFFKDYKLVGITYVIILILVTIVYLATLILSIFKTSTENTKFFRILNCCWIIISIPAVFTVSIPFFEKFFKVDSATVISIGDKSLNLAKLYIYTCVGVFLIEKVEAFFNHFYSNSKELPQE